MARRRLIVGRLAAGIFFFNLAFALIGGWLLSGPAAWISSIRLGYWGWAGTLFLASSLLSIPMAGAIISKLLRLPPEALQEPSRDKS
jgi:hypothetical protein